VKSHWLMIMMTAIYKLIISELGISAKFPPNFSSELIQKISKCCGNFNKCWKKCHRMKDRFEAQYASGLNREFRLSEYRHLKKYLFPTVQGCLLVLDVQENCLRTLAKSPNGGNLCTSGNQLALICLLLLLM
jgi:hypothetical protein